MFDLTREDWYPVTSCYRLAPASKSSCTARPELGLPLTVFRVVLANPLTSLEILDAILEEQRAIARDSVVAEPLQALREELQGAN